MEKLLNSTFNIISILINLAILSFLAFMTLVKILDNEGINVPFFSKNKRRRDKEFIEQIQQVTLESICKIYEKEYHFLINHEQERINSFLVQIGLKKDQFTKVKQEILKLQRLPMDNEESRIKKLTEICTTEELTLVDQSKLTKIKYNEVIYYIDLVDIMFEPNLSHDLAKMLVYLIQSNVDVNVLNTVDKIVVSTDGNFLFGIKVSEILNKPLVKMQKASRIKEDQYWAGKFAPNEKVIIVHDVLVTGNQIIDSINKFPLYTDVIGIFCLVCRTDSNGSQVLKDKGFLVHSVLSIKDSEIKKILEERKFENNERM